MKKGQHREHDNSQIDCGRKEKKACKASSGIGHNIGGRMSTRLTKGTAERKPFKTTPLRRASIGENPRQAETILRWQEKTAETLRSRDMGKRRTGKIVAVSHPKVIRSESRTALTKELRAKLPVTSNGVNRKGVPRKKPVQRETRLWGKELTTKRRNQKQIW